MTAWWSKQRAFSNIFLTLPLKDYLFNFDTLKQIQYLSKQAEILWNIHIILLWLVYLLFTHNPWPILDGTWYHGRHQRLQNSRIKIVAEEVGRSTVAQMMQNGHSGIFVVAEWMQSGRPTVATKIAFCCQPPPPIILSLNRRVFQGWHKGRRSGYAETRFSGFRWPLNVMVICWDAQMWDEVCSPV